jgi:hydrogenase nickel incorporation protein HypA/HybF
MHELSLAGNILQLVEQARAREADPFTRVTHLQLQAGALAGVEISALRFALESLAPGTLLEGAQIDIDAQPGSAWCLQCGKSVPIFSRLDLCPLCDGAQLQVTGGTELKVVDMRVV